MGPVTGRRGRARGKGGGGSRRFSSPASSSAELAVEDHQFDDAAALGTGRDVVWEHRVQCDLDPITGAVTDSPTAGDPAPVRIELPGTVEIANNARPKREGTPQVIPARCGIDVHDSGVAALLDPLSTVEHPFFQQPRGGAPSRQQSRPSPAGRGLRDTRPPSTSSSAPVRPQCRGPAERLRRKLHTQVLASSLLPPLLESRAGLPVETRRNGLSWLAASIP